MLGVVEKPTMAQAPSQLASVKGYVLPPTIFPFLKRVRRLRHGELYLTDAVALYNERHSVFACELAGELFDLGSKLGWLKANVALGLQRQDIRSEFRRFLKARV